MPWILEASPSPFQVFLWRNQSPRNDSLRLSFPSQQQFARVRSGTSEYFGANPFDQNTLLKFDLHEHSRSGSWRIAVMTTIAEPQHSLEVSPCPVILQRECALINICGIKLAPEHVTALAASWRDDSCLFFLIYFYSNIFRAERNYRVFHWLKISGIYLKRYLPQLQKLFYHTFRTP